MILEQIYLNCLSQASYLIGNDGKAVIVDPRRDVDDYLNLAERHGLKIEYVLETHFHADFVSGHRELADKTGATICFGPGADASYPIRQLQDGEEIALGSVVIRAMSTPGHTPESVCFLVLEDGTPKGVLTGDTLFVGAVGRPDLVSFSGSAEEMASVLYDSLHQKLMSLPDDVVVYPGHGPGSACGANLGSETTSTIGKERTTNYALQIESREEFVKTITSNIAVAPQYFQADARMNREGAGALSDVLDKARPLDAGKVEAYSREDDVVVLDVRDPDVFGEGHVPGSVNVGLGGRFASWVGTVIKPSARLVLVAPSGKHEEATMRLARVGYENVLGYLEGGIAGWSEAGKTVARLDQIDVEGLRERIDQEGLRVLDVRAVSEWEAFHIESANSLVLNVLATDESQPLPSGSAPMAVVCAGGYRSSIAASLLMRKGVDMPLINVRGGMNAWKKAGLPTVSEATV